MHSIVSLKFYSEKEIMKWIYLFKPSVDRVFQNCSTFFFAHRKTFWKYLYDLYCSSNSCSNWTIRKFKQTISCMLILNKTIDILFLWKYTILFFVTAWVCIWYLHWLFLLYGICTEENTSQRNTRRTSNIILVQPYPKMTKARLKIFYLNGNVRYLFPFAERCSPFLVDDDVKAWRGLYRLTPAATRNLAVCGFTGGTSPVVAMYDLQSALNPTLVTSGQDCLKERTLLTLVFYI